MVNDEQAIANLVFRYAEAVDAGDFELVGRLFAHATYRAQAGGAVHAVEGAEAVTAQMVATTRRYDDGTPRTRHQTTNLIIEVDDDRRLAACRSYFCVLQVVGGGLQPIIAGRYHDRLERVDDAWRFTDRLILPDLFGDLSEHLRIDLAGL
jgi:3-phenylpropionate/cinnamic acid dioxygenase small subunit